MPDLPVSPTTLMLDYLVRLEGKIDRLQDDLNTHRAAITAEQQAWRATTHAAISGLETHLQAELRTLRTALQRIDVQVCALHTLLDDDPFAGLELQARERAA